MVGFVKTHAPVTPHKTSTAQLQDAARDWLESINSRQLSAADGLIAEDATYHVSQDAFWIPLQRQHLSACLLPIMQLELVSAGWLSMCPSLCSNV